MSNDQPTLLQKDWNLFEYVIALNCTINDIYLATLVDTLKPSHIKNVNVRQYLEIVFDYFRSRKTLPNATELKTYLINDTIKEAYKDVVQTFKTLDTQYNQDELIANTEQYVRERAVFDAIKETVNTYSNPNAEKNPAHTLQLFEQACNISLIDNLGFDYFNRIDDHIDSIKNVEKHLSTGYKWLDKMLDGGWVENGRALYLFAGATNVGKSLVLGNLATKQLEQDRSVLVISLEMSELVYAKRISSQLTRLPIADLRNDTIRLKNQLESFRKSHCNSKLILKEFPPSSITTNNIKAYVKKLVTTTSARPQVLIIDYLTLLLATLQSGSMYSDGKSISEQLRALSYPGMLGLSNGIPAISAVQINRSGFQDANPELDKMGESMGITHTADAIFMLWQTEAEKELGVLNFGIRKNRFGINSGKQAFKIDYDTLSIDEMDSVFSNTSDVQSIDNSLEKLHI